MSLRGARGEQHTLSKLKNAQVIEIFKRAWAGEKQEALAFEYKVNQQVISAIKLGKRWKHLGLKHDGPNNHRRSKKRVTSIEESR